MFKRPSGFTLIEIIVVIVLLGALAFVALPKFLDLSGEAKAAVIRNLAGQMRTMSDMVHMKATIDGENLVGWNSDYTVAGQTIILQHGFPSNRNIIDLLDYRLTDGLELRTSGLTRREFRYTNAPDPVNCRTLYTHPANAGDKPTILISTSGC